MARALPPLGWAAVLLAVALSPAGRAAASEGKAGLQQPATDLYVTGAPGESGPRPGDVFREYNWRPKGKWQRVTGPDAAAEGAGKFLPNAVNRIALDDLGGAVKAEVQLEMLLCHGGTVGKRMRLNGGRWMPIPESSLIPGTSGQGPPSCEYQYMRYPTVELPLERLREGENTFEFTCCGGSSLGKWWPQWILYGATFRVYHKPTKPHPTGRITAPRAGATIGENAVFRAEASGPRPIRRVDFLGRYDDFNWEGDGLYRQWHGRTLYGQLHSHVGTALRTPYEARWDNRWLPTQDGPISVCARIVDDANLCCVTSAVEGLRLVRHRTVRMYRPYDVPKLWSTRAGKTHRCKVDVGDDLTQATAARVYLCTWNGVAADQIGLNGQKVVAKVGRNHDLSYDHFDVPLKLIRPGTNTLFTHSKTTHHGIEVQWPGMVLMVQYDRPEELPAGAK